MKLCVFGASGKVGQLVVMQLVDEGHQVTAFVHNHNPFEALPKVRIVRGDIMDRQTVQAAIMDCEAVISTLGSWGTKDKSVLSKGMRTILPAMESLGIKRLITLTGSGAFWSKDQPKFIDNFGHRLMGIIAPKILTDSEQHLQQLEASDLAWTCVRSPVMTGSQKMTYRLTEELSSLTDTIPRAAVAQCLVDQLNDKTYIKQAPIIHRK